MKIKMEGTRSSYLLIHKELPQNLVEENNNCMGIMDSSLSWDDLNGCRLRQLGVEGLLPRRLLQFHLWHLGLAGWRAGSATPGRWSADRWPVLHSLLRVVRFYT